MLVRNFLIAVLVELHARVGVFDRDDRSQTVGGFYDPGPNLEPLHERAPSCAADQRRVTGRVGRRNPQII